MGPTVQVTVSLARPVAYHHCGASVTHPVAPQPFNLTATQSATNVFLQTCPSSGLCIYAPASSLGKPIDGFTKRRLYVYTVRIFAKQRGKAKGPEPVARLNTERKVIQCHEFGPQVRKAPIPR